jgi:hypothetical protein
VEADWTARPTSDREGSCPQHRLSRRRSLADDQTGQRRGLQLDENLFG